MTAMPWVRFFPSDWLGGTRGMSAVEAGVYINLLAMMYERGAPLVEDTGKLARLCGASNSVFKRCLERLVDDGKIVRGDGDLWNERVGKEQSYRSEKSAVGKHAAKSRWRKGEGKQEQTDADAMQTQCERNANQKPDTVSPKSPKTEPSQRTAAGAASIEILSKDKFDELRSVFPRRDGGHPLRPAVKAWNAAIRAGNSPDRILASAKGYGDDQQRKGNIGSVYVKMLGPWINLRTFETANIDDAPVASAPNRMRLSMDTPDADRARHFIETGLWWQWWGPPPGDEDCYLPRDLQRKCLDARGNQHLPKDEQSEVAA